MSVRITCRCSAGPIRFHDYTLYYKVQPLASVFFTRPGRADFPVSSPAAGERGPALHALSVSEGKDRDVKGEFLAVFGADALPFIACVVGAERAAQAVFAHHGHEVALAEESSSLMSRASLRQRMRSIL